MLTYETIKNLCKKKGVAVTAVERELGFARGSLCKVNTSKPSMEKVQKLAEYFEVSVNYLLTGDDESAISDKKYYTNDETAEMADKIFRSKELRMLFDAAQDAAPEDLETVHSMLLALKRKERGNFDD